MIIYLIKPKEARELQEYLYCLFQTLLKDKTKSTTAKFLQH